MATTFTLISSTTVGSGGASTVTLSSIPQTYNDLVLYSNSRLASGGARYDGTMTMNSVTTNYRFTYGEGYATNSIYTSGANTAAGQEILVNQSNHTANYFSASQFYIANYTSTALKPSLYLQCDPSDSASQFYIQTGTGLFPSGAAISSLTITPNIGNIAQYSSFHLYGISYT
jgi:hypothetical protein